jgi:hypothetical protein
LKFNQNFLFFPVHQYNEKTTIDELLQYSIWKYLLFVPADVCEAAGTFWEDGTHGIEGIRGSTFAYKWLSAMNILIIVQHTFLNST